MVAELVRRGFLLTDLLPGCGTDDPLWHLLTKIPAANEVRGDLALIRRHLADADTCPPGQPRRLDLRTASATSPPATPAGWPPSSGAGSSASSTQPALIDGFLTQTGLTIEPEPP